MCVMGGCCLFVIYFKRQAAMTGNKENKRAKSEPKSPTVCTPAKSTTKLKFSNHSVILMQFEFTLLITVTLGTNLHNIGVM